MRTRHKKGAPEGAVKTNSNCGHDPTGSVVCQTAIVPQDEARRKWRSSPAPAIHDVHDPETTSVSRLDAATVARELNQMHSELSSLAHKSFAVAVEIGRRLHDIKATLTYGGWSKWVKQHLAFDLRTAQRYLRCHSNRDFLRLDEQGKERLTMTEAFRLLSANAPLEAAPTVDVEGKQAEPEPTTLRQLYERHLRAFWRKFTDEEIGQVRKWLREDLI